MSTKNEKIKGIARHFLTLIGGILISVGVINSSDAEVLSTAIIELIGIGFTIWGVVASWINKDKIAGDGNA